MTDRELMQRALEALDRVMRHGSAVQEAKDILRAALRDGTEQPIIKNYLEKDNLEPQRTHWEGCEEVHPECKQPEQEESEAVRAAWMAGYTEGEREAIENQPVQQQEPHIGWVVRNSQGKLDLLTDLQIDSSLEKYERLHKLYTTPPRRELVGLTDEEIERACVPLGTAMLSFTEVARAIEDKLKEKNK